MPSEQTNDRLWIILCHLSVFIGAGLILPLVVYLVVKKEYDSPIIPHAKEALNFHISLLIYAAVGTILLVVVVGIAVLFLVGLAAIVLPIVAALKASNDQLYRYPLTIRFVK